MLSEFCQFFWGQRSQCLRAAPLREYLTARHSEVPRTWLAGGQSGGCGAVDVAIVLIQSKVYRFYMIPVVCMAVMVWLVHVISMLLVCLQ